jgi:N-acetyltransferase
VIAPVTLEGNLVRLEPLRLEHAPQLLELALEAGSDFALTTVPNTLEGMERYIQKALEWRDQNLALPFVKYSKAQRRFVGSTRMANLEYWPWTPDDHPMRKTDGTPDALEIGWTWLVPAAQRRGINTEAKLLMLEHAFETLRVRRVTFKTDSRNERSRNAIQRIGATFEGVIRNHVPASDGGIRHSAMFSILDTEWPSVKTNLQNLLENPTPTMPK